MKKLLLATAILASSLIVSTDTLASTNTVGKINLGIKGWNVFKKQSLIINSYTDPKIPNISCYVSNISVTMSFSDPSNMSIMCRATGPIDSINDIDQSEKGEVVFKKSKSIGFKALKVRRFYDGKSKMIVYVAYSEKPLDGSYKNSISGVALWNHPVIKKL